MFFNCIVPASRIPFPLSPKSRLVFREGHLLFRDAWFLEAFQFERRLVEQVMEIWEVELRAEKAKSNCCWCAVL